MSSLVLGIGKFTVINFFGSTLVRLNSFLWIWWVGLHLIFRRVDYFKIWICLQTPILLILLEVLSGWDLLFLGFKHFFSRWLRLIWRQRAIVSYLDLLNYFERLICEFLEFIRISIKAILLNLFESGYIFGKFYWLDNKMDPLVLINLMTFVKLT